MKQEIIQPLKDFYSDRDIYQTNPSRSPFEGSAEIYEKHAERIRERLHNTISETMRNEVLKTIDDSNLSGQLNYLVEEIKKI